MITVRRSLLRASALGLPAAVLLAACGTPAATVISDAQAVATDAAQILALGIVPQPYAGIANLVLTGFQALLGVVTNSLATDASTESTVIASLTSAVKSAQASVPPGSAAANDCSAALTALASLGANATACAQAQAEAAVGTALIAYLTLSMPQSAALGAHASATGTLLDDANAHLAKMKA